MKTKYVCSICEKILKSPIILPCDCGSICKEHIAVKKVKEISCHLCHKLYHANDLIENLPLERELEQFLFLNENEKCFKNDVHKICEEIYRTLEKLCIKFDQFSLTQYDHFAKIKNDIDIKRETLLNELHDQHEYMIVNPSSLIEINEQSAQLIKQVESFENRFRNNYNQTLKPKLELIKSNVLNLNLDEFFRVPKNFKIESFNNLKCECKHELDVLEKKIKNFELFEYDLKRNKFVEVKSLSKRVVKLGKLDLHEDFLIDFDDSKIQNILTCWYNNGEINLYNLNKGYLMRLLKL